MTKTETEPETKQTEPETKQDDWLNVIASDLGMAVGEPETGTEPAPEPDEPKPEPDEPVLPRTETTPDPVTALLAAQDDDDDEPKPVVETDEPEAEPDAEGKAPRLIVKKQPPIDKVVKESVEEAFRAQSEAARQKVESGIDDMAPPPAENDFGDWTDEEIEQYELAKNAEALEPEKYKGLTESTKKFRDSVAEYISREQKEDPNRSFDSDDYEFMQFVQQHRPPEISKRDVRRVQDDMVARRAVDLVKRDYDGKLEDLRRENQLIKSQPKIEKAKGRFARALDTFLAKDENPHMAKFVKEASEIGWNGFSEKYPTLAPVFGEETQRGSEMAEEFVRIAERVSEYDARNPTHAQLAEFIETQGKLFAEKGGDARIRDGKTFIPRSEWAKLVSEYDELAKAKDPKAKELYDKAAKHWTYSDEEVLDLIALDTKYRMDFRLKSEIDRVKRSAAALGINLNEDGGKGPATPARQVAATRGEPEPSAEDEPKSPVVTSRNSQTIVPENTGNQMFSREELKLLLGS